MKGLNALTIALCLTVGFTACKQQKSAQQQTMPTYKVITTSLQDRVLHTTHTAVIEGKQYVDIRPQVSGTVTNVLVKEGAKVRKGQTLFIIDSIPYAAAWYQAKAAVASAEAQVASAKLSLEGKQELYKEKVISDFELQNAVNAFNVASAALEQAKAMQANAANNLSFTKVKSPVNGSAGMTSIRVGALVGSTMAQPLISVSDNSQMYVYFSLPEKEVLSLAAEFGSIDKSIAAFPEVSLTTSDGKEYSHKGRIDVISGIVKNGTVSMRAVFDNPDGLLMSGSSGQITIPYVKKDCIVIPQGATFEIQDKIFVYKIIDGKTVSSGIKVFKINDGKEYVVEDGLSVGEVIIAEGASLVREGISVNTVEKENQGE